MKVIGLSGWARSGKTTAADYIEREYGIRRVHIATTLRSMLAELLRANGMSEGRIYEHLEGSLKEIVIPEIGVSGRRLQILLGTEFGREMISDDLWSKTWQRIIERTGLNAMNDSVRFPNEEEAVSELGGFTIMIERDGCGPIAFKWRFGRFDIGRFLYDTFGLMWGVHPSERTDLLYPDYYVDNNGSVEDLYRQIDWIMADQCIEKLRQAA